MRTGNSLDPTNDQVAEGPEGQVYVSKSQIDGVKKWKKPKEKKYKHGGRY